MRVRFWGTRGTAATSWSMASRYGGNTSCVEVRSNAETFVILDCGTGLMGLASHLMANNEGPLRGNLLISHTHWDHIEGIPFFAPLFMPGNELDIYAPHGFQSGIGEALSSQLQHTYFPAELEQLGAAIRYHDLTEGTFSVGDISISARYLNHPALTLGFRLEADGVAIVYCCDHEPHSYALAQGSGEIGGQDREYVEFLADADLLIHDAQYRATEYDGKRGWGHSTLEYAVAVAKLGGVKALALTHHDPARD